MILSDSPPLRARLVPRPSSSQPASASRSHPAAPSLLGRAGPRSAPALPLAAGLWAGASLALILSFNPPCLGAGLGMAAIALGRWPGRLLAGLALGLLLSAVQGGGVPRPQDLPGLRRPVEAVVEVVSPWRENRGGRSVAVEIRLLKQGEKLYWQPRRAWLSLPLALPHASPRPETPGRASPAAELAFLPIGTRLRVKGHLRRSSGAWNRIPVPRGPWRLQTKSVRLVRVEREAGLPGRWSGILRRRLEQAWPAAPSPGPALARALLLGDRRDLPAAWLRGLRRWGLAHLLAVSGLHVGLLTAVVLVGGQLAGIPRGPRLLLALLAAGAYLLLVGPAPSLLRASLMVFLAVAALALERIPAGWNALSLALFLLLAGRVELVSDVGFQLTVAATAGLLGGSEALLAAWRRCWPRLPAWWGRPLAASMAAQLASLPFALPRFFLLSPLGCVANLVAIPWTALSLLGCLAWTVAAMIHPPAAEVLAPGLDLLAAPFAFPVRCTATVRWAVPVAMPAGGVGVLLAAMLAVALYALLRSPRWSAAALVTAGLLASMPEGLWREAGEVPRLVVLDIGQGDAILVRDGPRAILVDGGGWEGGDIAGRVLLPALLGEGVRRLEAVVLTHADLDHCGGLAGIVDYLPTEELWIPPGLPATGCSGELLLRAGLRPRLLWRGRERELGRWRLTALHPAPRGVGSPASDGRGAGTNEESLVLLAEVHGRRALLTGDIGAGTEREMLRAFPHLAPLDILKVAHHGSKSSSSRAFLRLAAPRLAVVSVGRENRYHHPAAEVVERFARYRIPLLRTDQQGALRIAFPPGGGMRVEVEGGDGNE